MSQLGKMSELDSERYGKIRMHIGANHLPYLISNVFLKNPFLEIQEIAVEV